MKLTLPSDPFAVRAALEQVRLASVALEMSDVDVARAEIVLAEILNNVVEHACCGRPDCRIDVVIDRVQTGLLVTVVDDGDAMPDGAPPAGKAAEIQCDLVRLPEGGFGWSLIRDLTRDVVYARSDGRNYLSFALDLNGMATAQ
ncbi:MAG: ATP-binding protein [Paracoccaceae bacterium]